MLGLQGHFQGHLKVKMQYVSPKVLSQGSLCASMKRIHPQIKKVLASIKDNNTDADTDDNQVVTITWLFFFKSQAKNVHFGKFNCTISCRTLPQIRSKLNSRILKDLMVYGTGRSESIICQASKAPDYLSLCLLKN